MTQCGILQNKQYQKYLEQLEEKEDYLQIKNGEFNEEDRLVRREKHCIECDAVCCDPDHKGDWWCFGCRSSW